MPADVFGNGKVLVFGTVIDKNGEPYSGDLARSPQGLLRQALHRKRLDTLNAANEIEGFLFEGTDAEQHFSQKRPLRLRQHRRLLSLAAPRSTLRRFIDTAAEVQSAPWVSRTKRITPRSPRPSSKSITATAKSSQQRTRSSSINLLSRQIANNMGFTASFLPKPVVGVNGSGMHTNMSITKDKTNLFWDEKGQEKLSTMGWDFIDRILSRGLDLCLILNSSVNAYRRLDPHFEAPNQIKASATDRGSMVRVPIGNSKSMRVEVRSVGPDANPYLTLFSIFKTGLDGKVAEIENLRQASRYLPDNIYTAIDDFAGSEWIAEILGADVQGRFADLKRAAADRSPRSLGTFVKSSEVQYHHEVYNQQLWSDF